jgi:STE24 endopeptidase
MQLMLLIQILIALVAEELSGTTPIGPREGLIALLVAPLAVLARGAFLVRRAHREMDAGRGDALERLYSAGPRSGAIVTLLMLLAATSAFPAAAAGIVGRVGVPALFLAVAMVATLVGYATTWSVEKRMRESALIRMLDAQAPLQPVPSRVAFVIAQARAGLLPILVPMLVPIALSELAREWAIRWQPAYEEQARFAGGVAGVLVLFLLVPVVIPFLLGLRRMPAGPMREELAGLAGESGVHVRELWVWPTDGLVANAAVMGVVPRLRCVMMSDCLLECMPREHVRAVLAHELGHVVHRHLVWMLVMVLASWTIAHAAISPIVVLLAEEYARLDPAAPLDPIVDAASMLRDLSVLAAGLWVFGYLSRRIERQADTFAVQLLSRREGEAAATTGAVEAMAGALHGVSVLNHVPPERPSWRHGSIAWRQSYLRSIAGQPLDRMAIDRTLAVLRWIALAVVVAAVVASMLPGVVA